LPPLFCCSSKSPLPARSDDLLQVALFVADQGSYPVFFSSSLYVFAPPPFSQLLLLVCEYLLTKTFPDHLTTGYPFVVSALLESRQSAGSFSLTRLFLVGLVPFEPGRYFVILFFSPVLHPFTIFLWPFFVCLPLSLNRPTDIYFGDSVLPAHPLTSLPLFEDLPPIFDMVPAVTVAVTCQEATGVGVFPEPPFPQAPASSPRKSLQQFHTNCEQTPSCLLTL